MSSEDDFEHGVRLTLALAQSLLEKLPPPDIVAAMLAAVLEFSKRTLGAEVTARILRHTAERAEAQAAAPTRARRH